MKHAPRISAALLLPLAVGLQAFAWYGARSVFAIHAVETHGATPEAFVRFSGMLTIATLCGLLLSVPLAGATGPLPIAALGMAVLAAGLGGAAAAGSLEPYQMCWMVAAFGLGLYRAPLYAAAARWLGRGQESARVAVFALLLLAINVGAFVAPLVGGTAFERLGTAVVFPIAAAAGLGAAILLLGAFAVPFVLPADDDGEPSDLVDGRALAIALASAVAAAVALTAWSLGRDVHPPAFADVPVFLYAIDPVVAAGTGALLAAGAGGAQLAGVRVPALLVAGIGFLALAAGLLVGLVVPGAVGFGLASALSGFGDVLAFAGALASATGRVHFRVATAPAAIVAAASSVGAIVAGPALQVIEATGGAAVVVVAAALVCGVTGIGFGVASVGLTPEGTARA